ncbi:MAG: YihY/virulence factor BrkB family protein [Bifidobacterium sp.]|jgi:membrane protein|nr:YihY/virulence factor BrkB family protein [Bifidobacterium sp.]MCH4209608.1 YihY/virulence factor BrkB family protein [Bifidobacterium sp.]MCI1225175.1 YihY/virulence factor BrkB family protein [Bifidobacterium sp.]
MKRIKELIDTLLGAWRRSLLGGMMERYSSRRGGLLANGLAYGLLFAFFAGLWTLFSVLGLMVSGSSGLQKTVIDLVGNLVPGVAHTLESTDALSKISGTLTWTGLVTLVSFWWSITGWMDSLRTAVHAMFDEESGPSDVIKTKLRDSLGVLLVIVLLLLSTVAGAISGGVMRAGMQLVGLPTDSFAGSLLLDMVGFLTGFVLNLMLFLVLLRVVAHIRRGRFIVVGSMVGALAFSVMQLLGGRLVAGAAKNPLLAPFAAIIGVLLWFNLMAQVIMFCAAFIAQARHRYGFITRGGRRLFSRINDDMRTMIAGESKHVEAAKDVFRPDGGAGHAQNSAEAQADDVRGSDS